MEVAVFSDDKQTREENIRVVTEKLEEAFAENDIDFRSGVYIQVTGPQYETPAEIRMFAGMGADAVGMSTVCEAIAARHMALEKYPDRNIAVINTCGAGGLPEQLTNIIY